MSYDASALYGDLTSFKAEINETGSTNDTRLTQALREASRVWDRLCNVPAGYFAGEASGAIRYLDVPDTATVSIQIPPAMAITAVATDEDGDRTYEVTWSALLDYRLYPLDGPPYTELRRDTVNGRYAFPVGDARLKLTGTMGSASAVPLPVQRAVRLLANRYRVRPNTPEGIASGNENMMALAAVDPDIKTILMQGRYRQPEIFA